MRLDELAERMGDRISITWKSFLLRTEPKTTDRAKFIEYTQSWLRPAAMEPKTTFTLWSEESSEPPTSSLPAQVAAKTLEVVDPERVAAYHRALLTAYFTDNRDISNWDVLIDVGAEVGVDRAIFADGLREHNTAMTQAVLDDHNAAIENAVTGVPCVVINGVLPIPGAQDVEAYERWITKIEQAMAATDAGSGLGDRAT